MALQTMVKVQLRARAMNVTVDPAIITAADFCKFFDEKVETVHNATSLTFNRCPNDVELPTSSKSYTVFQTNSVPPKFSQHIYSAEFSTFLKSAVGLLVGR